ncbi:Kelch repeat-containing protein kel-10 [Aphelenchoides besseyi]|nr:Kelch repeat-containing protein kel-10 [Aphelenchoides besseyi]
MEEQVRGEVVEKMNDQATEQSQLVLDCWQKQTEGTNYSDRNDLMTFNHKRLACSQPSILVDAHGDGPEICGLFFPESTIVLITVDGQRIGINRTLLSNKAFSFHLLDLNIKAVEVPAAYEPLVVLISAMYKEEESEIFRLFLKCNAKLLFAVFDVAVVFGAWRILNMLTAVICERSNPSTYVATMQLISTEQPRFANEMWKMIVGVFYRFKFDSSVGLITTEQMKHFLFTESLNILRGEEMTIFRQWKQIVHPNNSNEVDEMEERLTRMLVGSVQEQIPTRPPFSLLLTLGGWSFDGPTTEVEVFDGYRAQWLENPSNLAELPEARCYFAAISMREQKSIVVLGGMNEELYFNSSVSFNLDTMEWDQQHFVPMNESRCYVNAVALDESHILAAGGYDRTSRHQSAEMFSFERNVWTTVSSMNFIRSDGAAVELNEKVYVIGGFNGRSCQRSVEFYDANVDHWFLLGRDMREKRSGVGGLSIHGVLMAIGGYNGKKRLSSVEFYDPREGLWHLAEPMNLKRSNFGYSQLRDDPMIVGGYDGQSTTELVEFFDWRANRWYSGAPLRHRRSALSLFRLDDFENWDQLCAEGLRL